MEGAPFNTEDGPEKPDKPRKKKKKSAEALGSFVVEPKAEAIPPIIDREAPNWLEKLFDDGNAEKKPNPDQEEQNVSVDQSVEQDPALTTPAEDQIITERLTVAQPEPLLEPSPSAEEEVEAIETFRDKIVLEHKDAVEAMVETLDELSISPAEIMAETPPIDEDIPPLAGPTVGMRASTAETPPPVSASETDTAAVEDEASHSGSGTIPPVAPLTPAPGYGGAATSGPTPNVYPVTPARRPEYVLVHNEADMVGAALLAGILGYLLGRRRGRIKTEKRLLPVQKKLEKRVGDLQQDLIYKEKRIRQAVRRQAQQGESLKRLEKSDRQLRRRTVQAENLAADRQTRRPEIAPPRRHSPPLERLGQTVIGAEAIARTAQTRKPERQVTPAVKTRIATMDRQELLAVSENIPVERSNLRQIYETHLVSEQGLRRLVEVQAAGGDLKQALRQEIMEHEIDFERDPVLRDRRYSAVTNIAAPVAAVQAVLAKVVDDERQHDREAVLRAQIAHDQATQAKQQHQRQLMDIGLIGTILALTATIIILLLSR